MKPQIPTEFYKCRPVRILNKGWILFLFGLLFVFVGVILWVFFSPQPRLERVKIAMHDEQTFQKLRQKHGKVNTGIVVYEADGKAYFYNQKGEKVILK
jgi:hypothetical protein